jgi:hypothetical protein
MEMSGERNVSAALAPGLDSGAHRTGGWVGPRYGMDVSEKRKNLSLVEIRNSFRPACKPSVT